MALSRGQILSAYDIFPENYQYENGGQAGAEPVTLHAHMGFVEKDYILQALQLYEWQIAETAYALKISRKTLWEKMRRYGIQKAG